MPVNSITIQPAANDLKAAYRPIFFQVQATATSGGPVPPVVYADVYVNGVFYRTLSKLFPRSVTSTFSVWEFDVQSAVQEVLRLFLPDSLSASLQIDEQSFLTCTVKFRASDTTNNFLVPEGAVPVQATGNQVAQPGDGLSSEVFRVINATLKHVDNQNLPAHLSAYRQGEWKSTVFPVTHRPNGYVVGKSDTDFFPVLLGINDNVSKVRITYKTRSSGSTVTADQSLPFVALSLMLVDMPAGPANLGQLFTTINWGDVSEYVLQGLKNNGQVLFTTPTYKVERCEDYKRIAFQNYLGTLDFINLDQIGEEHETKSGSYQSATTNPFVLSAHSVNRNSVAASDTITCQTTYYGESDMDWIKELLDSGKAWEVRGNDYIPIVILDSTTTTRKEDGRYVYEVILKYKYSNELITQRQ